MLTLACLAVFAVALSLPRADGQLVGSDGTHYYVYLPSLVLDGDLDFSDEYAYFYSYDPRIVEALLADRTATGLPSNRLGIGPALLWAPFFVAAHLLALLIGGLGVNATAEGYCYLHQAPVLAGSILYGGLGAWFAFRAACLVVSSELAALAATLLTVLAGNLVYYMTVEPSMSHASSMFASSAFFYLWLRRRDRPDGWSRAGLGALAGLMSLIRPQDGLLLVLPLIDEAMSRRRAALSTSWWSASLSMAGTALLVFFPQLVVWKLLNGGFLVSGYAQGFGGLFKVSAAHVLDVMLSAERGLLTWHPVFLLAVPGMWLISRRDRRLAALCCLGFLIQWAVISSWHDWAQGDAFGGRMFIVLTPIFVLAVAAFTERIAGHRARVFALVGGAGLILLNFLLVVHYRLELLRVTEPLTFSELFLGRFRPFL